MRVYPWVVVEDGETLPVDRWAEVASEAVAPVNGGIGRANLPEGIITQDEIVVGSATTWVQERATTGVEVGPEDMTPGWNVVDDMSASITCQDGILTGAFCGTVRKYGADNGMSVPPVNWWEIGIFVDGVEVARTDRIHEEQSQIVVPFLTPIGSGSHTIEARYRGVILFETANAPSSTAAGTAGGEIFRFDERLLWACNRYR